MNKFALIGYGLIAIWQPVQIANVILTQDVSGISPLAIGILGLGLASIQVGMYQDKVPMIYWVGNALALAANAVLLALYFVFR